MRQVIYADVLVFMNTVVTFLLLLCVKQFAGVKTGAGRLVTASLTGGVYALVIFAPRLPMLLLLPARAAMGVSIVCIAFRAKNIRGLVRCVCLFLGFSFLFAGALYALRYALGGSFFTVNNGFGYAPLGVGSLIGLTVALYAVLRVLRKRVFGVAEADMLYDLTLQYGGRSVRVRALFDSGCSVRDVYQSRPVVILTAAEAEKLTLCPIPAAADAPAVGKENGVNFCLLPVGSLSGAGLLPAFMVTEAEICGENGCKMHKNVLVAVTGDALGGERYQALFGADLL